MCTCLYALMEEVAHPEGCVGPHGCVKKPCCVLFWSMIKGVTSPSGTLILLCPQILKGDGMKTFTSVVCGCGSQVIFSGSVSRTSVVWSVHLNLQQSAREHNLLQSFLNDSGPAHSDSSCWKRGRGAPSKVNDGRVPFLCRRAGGARIHNAGAPAAAHLNEIAAIAGVISNSCDRQVNVSTVR